VLWLIGMMGAGKTTIGAKVAAEVGVPFFDTDQMVVDMSGMSIERLWSEHGEPGFRSLERRAVERVPDSDCVVAAGGGTVLDPASRDRITRSEMVLWLKCSVIELSRRLDSKARPLLGDDVKVSLEQILDERASVYEEMATHILNTDRLSVERAVMRAVRIWTA
jgi:shikimate kinase